MPGLSTFQVPLDVLFQVLRPGDRYDEASGVVTRLSGQQVAIAALLSPGATDQPIDRCHQAVVTRDHCSTRQARDNPMSSANSPAG